MIGRKTQQSGASAGTETSTSTSILAVTAARIDELVAVADGTYQAVKREIDENRAKLGESRHDALVDELAKDLVERVDGLRAEARDLRKVLERAGSAMGVELPTPTASAASALSGSGGGGGSDGPSQGLLLLVTQMAVAGSDRSEIASRLRDDFGVKNTDEVLSQALGSPNR